MTRSGLVPREVVRILARRVWRAGRRIGVPAAILCRTNLYITDDAAMTRLNRRHMGKRGPTDVLSFPTGEWFPASSEAFETVAYGEPPLAALLGPGDIVINWQAVARQARATGNAGLAALIDEATVLAVHGLAHLLGHDHARAGEGRRMHAVERRALAAVGVADIPRPY